MKISKYIGRENVDISPRKPIYETTFCRKNLHPRNSFIKNREASGVCQILDERFPLRSK